MFHKTWGILICDHDRDWKYIVFQQWKCLFFYFLLFVSLFHLLAFHCRQNKMRGGSISSAKLQDKTRIKLDVLRMFHHFFFSSLWDDNFFELDFFPPWCSYCVAHEANLLTGHQGNELISLSTQIFCFCYSCHISVRCGSSSSWNNEAMFHC